MNTLLWIILAAGVVLTIKGPMPAIKTPAGVMVALIVRLAICAATIAAAALYGPGAALVGYLVVVGVLAWIALAYDGGAFRA